MKYIVEVNAKYLVSVEATSCLDAEHQLLDCSGVWGALAYDQKMTKTDTFLGAVQGCEMVSMNEFARMVGDLMDAKLEAVQASEMVKAVDERIEELKKRPNGLLPKSGCRSRRKKKWSIGPSALAGSMKRSLKSSESRGTKPKGQPGSLQSPAERGQQ